MLPSSNFVLLIGKLQMRNLKSLSKILTVLLVGFLLCTMTNQPFAQENFDHAPFDKLLKKYVNQEGMVDYKGIKTQGLSQLDAYLKTIDQLNPKTLEQFNRSEKIAFYTNAYNAFTIKLITDHYPVTSIKKIPGLSGWFGVGQWKSDLWTLAGQKISLNTIEHKILRPMGEPRIHFVLVCAAIGCPSLAQTAYTAENLERLFNHQAKLFHASAKGVQITSGPQPTLSLSPIYKWFKGDFLKVAPDLETFVAQHSDEKIKTFIQKNKGKLALKYHDYDWSLNEQK